MEKHYENRFRPNPQYTGFIIIKFKFGKYNIQKENTMDLIQYGQYYNDAMTGMDSMFDDMKESMKNFNKKRY